MSPCLCVRNLGLLAAGLVLAGGAGLYILRSSRHLPVSQTYVNPAVCNGCHEEIARTYRQTGMGRAFYRPRPENTVEDYTSRNTFYHRASDRYYTMTLRDGKPVQRRHQIGFDGNPNNIIEKTADFAIGSGNHARSYLHRTPEGKLVQLPVSWYADNGGYWAMSPGYDRPDQQDFRRAMGLNCMFCHNGYPPDRESYSVSSEPVFAENIPEGIDCQRCHGPGRSHVDAAGSGRASFETIRRAIVNPARLARDRQVEVCMQCHLEPTSGRLPNVIFRYGRGPFSFRSGEPLGDSFLYFDHAPGTGHDDKFEIAHAAYRLRKSACFQSSEMTCTTCHNPHDVPRGPAAVSFYDSKCRSCHAAVHASENAARSGSCIDCHMPRSRTDDAVHVVMTDHYIQRTKPGDLLAPRREVQAAYRGEVVLYYPSQIAPAESDLYLSVAQVRDESNLEAGIPRLRQAIETYKPAAPEFYLDLARAYLKAGNYKEAISWCEEALRRRADFEPAARELAVALIASGDLPRAAEVLEKAPPDAAILTNLGNVYLRQGNTERARQTLAKALSMNPDEPDANNLMGMACAQKLDRAAAEQYFRKAISAQPDLAAAHHNLANLLASTGDYRQAAWHFEKAITAAPDYAEARHRYALALIVLKSYDKALRELREAVRLNPNFAEAHSDLADLLVASGRPAEAQTHFEKANALRRPSTPPPR